MQKTENNLCAMAISYMASLTRLEECLLFTHRLDTASLTTFCEI